MTKKKNRDSPLWMITSSQGVISFVFGTIHVCNALTKDWLDLALSKLHLVSVCMCETDLDDMSLSPPEYYLKDFDLKEELGYRKYVRIENALRRHLNITLDSYVHVHPFWLNAAMILSIIHKKGDVAMDQQLWKDAKELNLEMKGVESMERQNEIFKSLSVNDQLKEFLKASRHLSKFKKNSLNILELYAQGKIECLYRMSKKSLAKSRHLLIYERNERMLDSIIKNIKNSSCFIAVGCGHLPGERGLLRGLKHAGYLCEPVYKS